MGGLDRNKKRTELGGESGPHPAQGGENRKGMNFFFVSFRFHLVLFVESKGVNMKNVFVPHPSFVPVILGIATLLAGGAFAPSSSLPADPQSRSLAQADILSAAPAADSLIRIAFTTGTTSATVSGTLASGASQSYVLWAGWNQVMIVQATSADSKIYLEIYNRATGYYLVKSSSALTSWQGWLPRTGDYIVKVYNGGGNSENYSLLAEIPARIQFAQGAYSKSVWGRGSAAQTISYVLWARANQTMTATLTSSTGTVYLAIRGFSGGQTLVASSSSQTTWTGTLPQSQEYIIDAVQGGTWVDFTLTVKIV